MAFAIFTYDKPGLNHVRQKYRDAHYSYLEEHKHLLIASGGLQDDPGEWMIGGLIILDVESAEEALNFCDSDPFTKAGLFKSIDVVRWKAAYIGGKRQ